MAKKKKDAPEQHAEETTETAVDQVQEEGQVEESSEADAAAEQLRALAGEVEVAREESQRNRDLYLRSVADLDNYRKRAQREKEDTLRFANENILREILPVVDNLERALDHARSEGADNSALLEGVERTLSQFTKVLEKFNVKPVSGQGEVFDPAFHEAIGQVESADMPSGSVAKVLQRGYLLNDRLLRPAMVMVSKAPAQS